MIINFNDNFTKFGPQFIFFECHTTLKIIVLTYTAYLITVA